jgi:hypothetical protein
MVVDYQQFVKVAAQAMRRGRRNRAKNHGHESRQAAAINANTA